MMTPAYQYRARVVDVTDGDTLKCDLDLGFHVHAVLPVRVRGVFAAERRTPEGIRQTAQLKALLDRTHDLIVVSYKDAQSFERWVCDLYLDGRNLAELWPDPPEGTGA